MHTDIRTALDLLAVDFPQFSEHLLSDNYDMASTGAAAASAVCFSLCDLAKYRRTTAIAAACVYADQGNMPKALATLTSQFGS